MSENELKKWNDAYSDGMRDGYQQGREDMQTEILEILNGIDTQVEKIVADILTKR